MKNIVVKDERVLSFYNLDTAKKCVVFWVAGDVPVSSVNKASCKVGYGTGHDIDFDGVRDIDDFMERLFKLLTKINTY